MVRRILYFIACFLSLESALASELSDSLYAKEVEKYTLLANAEINRLEKVNSKNVDLSNNWYVVDLSNPPTETSPFVDETPANTQKEIFFIKPEEAIELNAVLVSLNHKLNNLGRPRPSIYVLVNFNLGNVLDLKENTGLAEQLKQNFSVVSKSNIETRYNALITSVLNSVQSIKGAAVGMGVYGNLTLSLQSDKTYKTFIERRYFIKTSFNHVNQIPESEKRIIEHKLIQFTKEALGSIKYEAKAGREKVEYYSTTLSKLLIGESLVKRPDISLKTNIKTNNYIKNLLNNLSSTDNEKTEQSSISEGGKTTNIKIIYTNSNTTDEKLNLIGNSIETIPANTIILWIDDKNGGKYSLHFGSSFDTKAKAEYNKYFDYLGNHAIPVFGNENPIKLLFHGVAGLIAYVKIPTKFYDPNTNPSEYNPIFADLIPNQAAQLALSKMYITLIPGIVFNSTNTYSRALFALQCSAFNSTDALIQGLVKSAYDVPAAVYDFITIENYFEDGFNKFTKAISDNCKQEMARQCNFWDYMKYGLGLATETVQGNACKVTINLGAAFVQVATVYFSFAKVGQAAKIGTILEALDVTTYMFQGAGKIASFAYSVSSKAIVNVYRFGSATSNSLVRIAAKGRSFVIQRGTTTSGFSDIPSFNSTTTATFGSDNYEILLPAGVSPNTPTIVDIELVGTQKFVDANGNSLAVINNGDTQMLVVVRKAIGAIFKNFATGYQDTHNALMKITNIVAEEATGYYKVGTTTIAQVFTDGGKKYIKAFSTFLAESNLPNVFDNSWRFFDDIKLRRSTSGEIDGFVYGCNGTTCGIYESMCFVQNTLVSTPNGLKPIQDIKVGDLVNSYNELLAKTETRPVLKTSETFATKLIRVITERDTLFTTPTHPFFTKDGWRIAAQLTAGTSIMAMAQPDFDISASLSSDFDKSKNEVYVQTLGVSSVDTTAFVYNFSIEANKNYFVGQDQLLVHNAPCPSDDFGKWAQAKISDAAKRLLFTKRLKTIFPDPVFRNEFAKYLNDNPDVASFFINGTENSFLAFKSLKNHPDLIKQLNVLTKAESVLSKGHVSSDDIIEILQVNAGLGRRAEAVADLLDGIDNFYIYNGRGGFQTVLNALKADWYNGIGADGANWVLAIVKKESDTVFPPGTTAFEVPNAALGRTYDAVVTGTPNKYFEFKSVQNLPPSNFADQFTKDLNNPNITNLNQLKWMFDKAKYLKKAGITEANIEAKFVEDMKRAIDGLDFSSLPDNVLTKFQVTSKPALKAKLKNEFNDLFFLK